MFTVLLTDGAFTGLIRSLREAYAGGVRIVGLSTDPDTSHQAILDAFYVVSSHDEPGYMDELIRICRAENVDIIFPVVTEGIEDLMDNEAKIRKETGAGILSSPSSSLRISNDKGLLYSFLGNSDYPEIASLVPLFFLADTKTGLFEAIHKIRGSGKKPCIKRLRGEDAAGFWIIDDEANFASQLFYEEPKRIISQKILDIMLENVNEGDSIPPCMACEFLPGEEWDCDVLCMDGKLISVTTRINLCMCGGLTSVLEVKDNPGLVSLCAGIVSALSLSYVVCISFRADADGHFFLLEINPRMMGNIYVSSLAGNNYVKMAVDLFYGKKVQAVPPKSGIKTALFYDQLQISPK